MHINPSACNNAYVRIIERVDRGSISSAYLGRILHVHAVYLYTRAAPSASINTMLMYSDERTPVKVIRYVLRVDTRYYYTILYSHAEQITPCQRYIDA